MKTTILVVEDDYAVRNLIATTLETAGYAFETVKDGRMGISVAASMHPNIIILDLGLPDMDGTEVIRKIRSWSNDHIIIVSARNEVSDKIEALDAGADDYLSKPFSVDELLARIRVAERKMSYDKSGEKNDAVFINGNLKIDYVSGCVFVKEKQIHLTPMEYKLLCLMAKNVGKVLTHNYILKEIWGSIIGGETRSLRVFMAALRRKIEKDTANPEYIYTHVGIGYRMIRVPCKQDKEETADKF